jgi:hypothetical protein
MIFVEKKILFLADMKWFVKGLGREYHDRFGLNGDELEE